MLRLTRYYQKMLGVVGGLSVGLLFLIFFTSPSPWLVAGTALAILLLTSLIFGFEYGRWRERGSLVTIVLSLCGIWLIIEYLCGIWLGFARNQLNLDTIFGVTVPLVITLSANELIRATLVKKAGHSRPAIAAIWGLATSVFVWFLQTEYVFVDNLRIAEFVFIDVFPWVAQSIFLTLVAHKGGWLPAVIFAYLAILPMRILPYVPAFDSYLMGIANLLLPVVGFYVIRRVMRERDEPKQRKRFGKLSRLIYHGSMAGLTVGVIALSSGLFKYYPLSIASGSMAPNLRVGDFVIVKKLTTKDLKNLQMGDVLVFAKQDKVIVHRIVSLSQSEGRLTLSTKGDANKDNDNWIVTEPEIIGTASLKLPMVGLPTLWVHNLWGER